VGVEEWGLRSGGRGVEVVEYLGGEEWGVSSGGG